MGKMDKTEKYTVAGLCFGGSGVFLCEDAVVCARVYGYCDGTVVEFWASESPASSSRPSRSTSPVCFETAASKRSSPAVAPSASAAGSNGRTGDGDTVGTREGALWHVSHIDRY